MKTEVISKAQIEKRKFWIDEIIRLSGNFGVDAEKVEDELGQEIKNNGIESLLGHLRLCGAIPEQYSHDSSEEKLYSKYTDVVIHEAYSYMGFNSLVLKERADVADVECVSKNYSFVADAKAFRLSRTAKNQKDFYRWLEAWKAIRNGRVPRVPIALAHKSNLSAGRGKISLYWNIYSSCCSCSLC